MVIHLQQLVFTGNHGLYKEEKITGGTFIADIDIEIPNPSELIVNIYETVNYVQVYNLVKARMLIDTPLIETIVMEMADLILGISPLIIMVTIRLAKQGAPIINFEGKVAVTYTKSR